MSHKTIGFQHFGCKVNFAEGSTISRKFAEMGYEIVDFREAADIYVINTCVVTSVAEKKCRAAIRQAHRRNPSAKIAVIGCFSELKKEEIRNIEGVSVILGQGSKFSLPEEIERIGNTDFTGQENKSFNELFMPSFSYGDRTRSFLKIQDGCDYYCAYCTIPFARGHSRSDTISNVLKTVKEIIHSGIKEIILTGVNIGDFGRENGESFPELLQALREVDHLPRIRISSIEPDLLHDSIIQIMAETKNFMPHFHIPLQSGSKNILKSMKRKYDPEFFTSRVNKIRSLLPDACIASDIIAGFPGETEQDFMETVQYISQLNVSYLHVFTYSKREKTLASGMGNEVPATVIKERGKILQSISDQKKLEFYSRNQGQNVNVLFESANSHGWMHGFTENYLSVKTKFNPELINKVVSMTLGELEDDMTFIFQT